MESRKFQNLNSDKVEMGSADLQILNSSKIETDRTLLNSDIMDYNKNNNNYTSEDDDIELQSSSTQYSFIHVRTWNQSLITLLIWKLKKRSIMLFMVQLTSRIVLVKGEIFIYILWNLWRCVSAAKQFDARHQFLSLLLCWMHTELCR